jgi:UPF0176 protein
MKTSVVNIASYKFVTLSDLESWRQRFVDYFSKTDILGTILMAEEGVNLMLAGSEASIAASKDFLMSFPEFSDLTFKETVSKERPFSKFKVKVKAEIVPMGIPGINPSRFTGPTIAPEELKSWYDTGKDFIIIDTRNDYELEVGAFDNIVDLNLHHFRDFDKALDALPESMKEKDVVIYCTGGIRCEKASPLMMNKGFKNVYQLDGGIINYFKKVGGEHYHGDCFIFDHRTSITPTCEETGLSQCEVCQQFVTAEEQAKTDYKLGGPCIHCKDTEIWENFRRNPQSANFQN